MSESSGMERPSSDSLRETVTSIVRRNLTAGTEAIVDQLMYVMLKPEELPTIEQMQTLINMAYQLGWKDRDQAVWRTEPPTVTLEYEPGKRTTFLYDGKPRP